MKISRKWLEEYLELGNIDIKEIEERYTKTGTKVEKIEEVGKYKNVVVGKILEIEKHPDAEKLVVTKVLVKNDETKEVIQIVTGASNINVGDIIPVAKIGAILPNGMEIKAGKLRGVDSNGMMCSCGELNLPLNFLGKQDSYGIMMLPKEYENHIGELVENLFGKKDEIIEFEITPNRPDSMGTVVLAKELAVALNKELKTEDKKTISKQKYEKIEKVDYLEYDGKKITVDINTKDSTRYLMAVVKNVKLQESPAWLQERLAVLGTSSKNNIVDLSNYVMFETGNPTHVFDLDILSEIAEKENNNKIEIKVEEAIDGEELELLDETKIILEDDMMIKLGQKNLVLAGIMGGKESALNENTKNILIEIAAFKRQKIRRESRKHNIRTESSSRFEKNLPVTLPEFAMVRMLELIEKLGIAEVEYKIIDVQNYDEKVKKEIETKNKGVKLDVEKINEILGIKIEKEYIINLLKELEFEIDEEKEYVYTPYLRNDISNIQDIAEEVIRFYGYDNLESTLPNVNIEERKENKLLELKKKTKTYLVSQGYSEIMTYGFISKKDIEKLELKKENPLNEYIEVVNKLSSDYEVMRTTHVPSVLNVVSYNEKNGNENLKLFEIAKVFKGKEKIQEGNLPLEEDYITMVFTAKKEKYKEKAGTQMEYVHINIYKFKKEVETLLNTLEFRNYIIEQETENEIYHKAQCANIKVGRDIVGTFGKIHPKLEKNFELNEDVYVCQLNLESIKKYSRNKIDIKEIVKYPKVTRDISVLVDKKVTYSEIQNIVTKSIKGILEKVSLFDIYLFDDEENKDKKSVSIKIELRNSKKTLEENEIKEAVEKVIANLEKQLNAKIR